MMDKRTAQASGYSVFMIGGIAISLDTDENEVLQLAAKELRRAGINPARLNLSIYKRSVDARKKNSIKLVYSVRATAEGDYRVSEEALKRVKYPSTPINDSAMEFSFGDEVSEYPPLVVGMGPCGIFCALLLAENGYRPILIDRGDGIAERVRKTTRFTRDGELDPESNIQFGAGGAGTFSDGKLVTRVNDARINYILRRFCDFGAPEDILVNAKPHIGTDLLVNVVDNMLARIRELGGKVIYRCRLDGIEYLENNVRAVTTSGDIMCSSLVLAPGHSARDTYEMLMKSSFSLAVKPFSVGVRIEHLADDIDRALYGDFAGHARLGRAEYHLSDTTSGRGVYTFCMCPGGEVVAAASERGGVVVNGMSKHARDGVNSNSAVLVSVRSDDIGGTCRDAIEFQRRLERAAFEMGGGDYYAPVQTVGDFLGGKVGTEPSRVMPTYRDGKVRCADIDKLLPRFVGEELRLGLYSFDKKLGGFAARDAVMTGVETRSSAPVRILRTEALCALGHDKIYPGGEGAGYAGGITSAALDGVRVAIALMERFAPAKIKF